MQSGHDRARASMRPAGWMGLLTFVLMIVMTLPAWAGPLDDAKQSGTLGERGDGYLGLVDPGAPASAKSLMKEVNEKRRAQYRKIAHKNEISVDAVATEAGRKLVDRAAPGEYVREKGKWVQR